MELAERIDGLLKERGLSQSELARRVGLRQSTINYLVNGRSRGSKHLHVIARELGTTAAYLAGETDDPDAGAAPAPDLSHDESRLLAIYRGLAPKDQAALKHLISRMGDE